MRTHLRAGQSPRMGHSGVCAFRPIQQLVPPRHSRIFFIAQYLRSNYHEKWAAPDNANRRGKICCS